MDENTEKQDEAPPVTLQPRHSSNPIVSMAKKLGLRTLAWIGVYMLGYFDFSVAWMITPLLLSVMRDQWKKDKRNKLTAARESALSNEQAMIEARMNVEDLPSWVFFPDKERAEWVNSILKQVWPYVNDYVRHTLFNTVEPAVESALKAYKLTPFKFERERVFLGQVPPRITGIKVYDTNTSRKEIIMDLDIVFASDLEIVFKVKGIPARVSDFGLRGMARVVLKPLISQIPLVGGIQVYFLKAPDIDYTLGGVAGTLEIPGLNKIVERIIIEQVKNFIVLPNKFSMPLVNTIPNKVLKCPDSAGVLRVKLMRASDLVNKDGFASGKSDPYIIMTVGAHTHRVPTINDTCNPHWDLTYDFPIEVVQGQELLLEFYDDDDRQDDEFLGRAKIQTSVVAERGYIEGYWVDLVDTESGKVQVTLSWLPVIDDSSTVKTAAKHAKPNDDSAKGLVHIYIDSCSGLFNQRDPTYKPSPMVRLISNHEKSQQSWPKYYTNDPIIEQGFVMLIRAPYTDEIKIDVIDTASKKDDVIGTCTIRIWSLIEQPGMEYTLQPWLLKGNSPDAKIVMSASLRGLLPPQCSPRKGQRPTEASVTTTESFSAPTSGLSDLTYDDKVMPGRIRLLIHKAEELEKKDVGGKSDPYVVISYETQRAETQVCKKTISPVWDHEVWVDITENGDNQITLELFDKDKIGKDEKMGRTTIDVRRISKQKKLSQIWDTLIGCKSGKILWSAEFFFDAMVQEPDNTNLSKTEEVPAAPEASVVSVKSPYREENAVKRDDEIPKPPSIPDELPEIDQTPPSISSPDSGYVNSVSTKEVYTPDEVTVSIHADAASTLGYMGNVLGGFLRVTVHRAEDLVDKDIGGESDPYVVIRYSGQKNKSKHVKGNLNPEFEFTTGYVTEDNGPSDLSIEIMDHDLGKDETLGICSFDLRKVMGDGTLDNVWATLEGVKSGQVLVSMDFSGPGYNDSPATVEEPLTDAPVYNIDNPTSHVDTFRRRPVGNQGKIRLNILYDTNKEELKVFVHEAANLPGSDLPDPPDPYVKIYLMPGKKKKKKTAVVKDTGSPMFNEEFDFNIDHEDVPKYYLKLTVVDKKGVFAKSPVLGTVDIYLDNPGLSHGLADWYPLEDLDEDSD
eukprot:TRINITY_DN26933_c0_g1_i7.p1 TRINITY_DN26933_c0_g1~~TRINITY_DN26933_c0_g1_i7.p1  ORF type:complete len:1127 (+),score=330.64 TRINITY_DN26933_c0_g1_i7:171-3551(+)